MKTLGILGAGDLGRQIAHYALSDRHYKNVVFFDDFFRGHQVHNMPFLGDSSEIESAFKNQKFDELIIAIGYKHLSQKKAVYNTLKGKIPFGKIVHSSSWVDKTAVIEEGCVIYPRCIIDANCVIKTNSILNIGCSLSHDSVISSHCFLSPRVAIAGFTTIKEECVIGINATIIDNLTMKEKSKIGAGAVVIKAIEKSGLYVGNPARFIR